MDRGVKGGEGVLQPQAQHNTYHQTCQLLCIKTFVPTNMTVSCTVASAVQTIPSL